MLRVKAMQEMQDARCELQDESDVEDAQDCLASRKKNSLRCAESFHICSPRRTFEIGNVMCMCVGVCVCEPISV